MKTVNHRFFNAHLKTPYGFDRYEGEIQSWLKGFFSRGHVNLTLVLERNRAAGAEGLPRARSGQGPPLLGASGHTPGGIGDLRGGGDLFGPPVRGPLSGSGGPGAEEEVSTRRSSGRSSRKRHGGLWP